MSTPVEVDKIEIRVLVNDQIDNLAQSWHPDVEAGGRLSHLQLHKLEGEESKARGDAKLEFSFASSCCGAHGLSLLIVRFSR